jgi:hypothetical protein
MIVRIAARDSPADKLPQSMPVDSLMDSLGRQMLPDDDDDSESSQSRNQTPLPESKQFARSTRRHRQ